MDGGIWGPSTVRTESEAETDHTDDEGGGEGKAAAPDGGDCHGLVEAEETDPEVEQEQDGLGVSLETVYGGTDGDQGPQCLGEPDTQQVHSEQHEIGGPAIPVTHEQVVQGGAHP